MRDVRWGFLVVFCVMKVHGELVVAKRYEFGCHCCLLFAPLEQVTPTVAPFSVSVVAVVANKVGTPSCEMLLRMVRARASGRRRAERLIRGVRFG